MGVQPQPDPDEWGRESFPASDPPSGWQGPEEDELDPTGDSPAAS